VHRISDSQGDDMKRQRHDDQADLKRLHIYFETKTQSKDHQPVIGAFVEKETKQS